MGRKNKIVETIDEKELYADVDDFKFNVDGMGMDYLAAKKLYLWLRDALDVYQKEYGQCFGCLRKIEMYKVAVKVKKGIVSHGRIFCTPRCKATCEAAISAK